MEALLRRFGTNGRSEPERWSALVDALRPARASDTDRAADSLRALIEVIGRRQDLRIRLRESLIGLFRERKLVSLYVSSGLLPSSGFFTETARRISNRLLPEIVDPAYMRGLLTTLFHHPGDETWVAGIGEDLWAEFITTLFDEAGPSPVANGEQLPGPVLEIIEALRILSYHVSSIGLDPELVRIDPTLEEHESPFMAQNAELVAYLANYRSAWNDPEVAVEDERHLVVMLDQCEDVVLRIRRKAAKIGTSLSLTFKLERLHQHLTRIAALLELLIQIRSDHRIVSVAPLATRLFIELTTAECRKNALSDYWGKNLELLSLRMTESASRSGEHYITSTRSEYFGIMRSAALGGLIIALMASLKIVLDWQGFAPLNEALMFCLNYGIGFALIHILGGTVATKQPAMTANAIAASIGETRGRNRDLGSLADLIVRTIRSQIAAIIGNIGVAIPMAMLVSIAVHLLSGEPFLAPDDARYLLDEVNPLGATLIFAAMAGVCLFLSGLIAGYYDNLCAYGRIPQRLLQLRWPRRMLGERPVQRIADYVENNLGALAGNFFFGFLLGGVTALGTLFGLPLDIRHIAFSSAYVGHAIVGLDFSLPWQIGLLAAGGIVLIGVVNLAVSFSLSLAVAMRARRITFDQGKDLVALVLTRLRARPMDLFRAPPDLP